MKDIEKIISEMSMKDAKVLCREVMSINDTMDVLRSKWVVEILSAILYGSTRFKAIQTDVHGISEKVLTERLYAIIYQMTEWGVEHRRLML